MDLSRIVESLRPLAVEIGSITPYPANPRRGKVERIRESLRTYGQYKPVVVQRSSGHVIAGNHTLHAMIAEGGDAVAAAFVDVDDSTARRIVAMDNRTSDEAEYDELERVELLKLIQAEEDGLDGSGYSDADLAVLMEQLTAEADALTPPDDDEDDDLGGGGGGWVIVVTLEHESAQVELADRLREEGYRVRVG